MTLETNIENLRFPIGRLSIPEAITQKEVDGWISIIEQFPFDVFQITSDLMDEQLSWAYRPEGWSIRQLMHH